MASDHDRQEILRLPESTGEVRLCLCLQRIGTRLVPGVRPVLEPWRSSIVERLEVGQRAMVFELVAFEVDLLPRCSGSVRPWATSRSPMVVPASPDLCRLVVKLLLRDPNVPVFRTAFRCTAAPLDLVMMR